VVTMVLGAVLAAPASAGAARAMIGEGHAAAGQGRHGEEGHGHPQDVSHVNAPS
jgi:hypothetical protein